MRWDDFRRSDNVEDDRGAGGGFGGGGGFGIPGGGGLGIGTVIVLGLIGWATGIDPSILIGGARNGHQRRLAVPAAISRPANRRTGAPSDQTGQFVAAVLGNTEDTWSEIFRAGGQQYRAPRLRLYRRRRAGRLRLRAGRDGAVLLPDRPAHLSRHLVLPRHAGALPRLQRQGLRIRRGLCDRARGRPSRAEPARHAAEGAAGAARRRQQGGGQPHPGAGRIAGRLLRRRLGAIIPTSAGTRSSRATSRRRCRPPPRSATTGCRSRRAATWCRTPSPTALRRSASAGSPPA